MKRLFTTTIFATTTLLASFSQAAVVYDESVSGDLEAISGSGGFFPIFSLQSGSNEFRGTFSYFEDEANGIGSTIDRDGFRFNLAQGLTLDSYTLTLTTSNVIEDGTLNGLRGSFGTAGYAGTFDPWIYNGNTPIGTPTNVVSVNNLNIVAGVSPFNWSVRINGTGHGGTGDFDKLGHVEFSYVATAFVSGTPAVVPIPAGAWLFLSAIGGLVGVRLRKR
jgi:hypothetical protein